MGNKCFCCQKRADRLCDPLSLQFKAPRFLSQVANGLNVRLSTQPRAAPGLALSGAMWLNLTGTVALAAWKSAQWPCCGAMWLSLTGTVALAAWKSAQWPCCTRDESEFLSWSWRKCCCQQQHILLVMSIHATCFGRTDHRQTFKNNILKFNIKCMYILNLWNLTNSTVRDNFCVTIEI
jgi:hypothetical protein